MLDYAYLAAALFWAAVLCLLLLIWPRHRPAMLWTALLLGGAGPISEYWFLQDYWRPRFVVEFAIGSWRFGLEDWLATAALAGVCAGVFERLVQSRGVAPLPRMTAATVARVWGLGLAGLGLMYLFGTMMNMGSINAMMLAILLVSLGMLAARPEVALLTVLLALLATFGYWVFYAALFVPVFPQAFQELWNLEQTCGLAVLGVPVEEFIWVGETMLFAGPLLRICSPRPGTVAPRIAVGQP